MTPDSPSHNSAAVNATFAKWEREFGAGAAARHWVSGPTIDYSVVDADIVDLDEAPVAIYNANADVHVSYYDAHVNYRDAHINDHPVLYWAGSDNLNTSIHRYWNVPISNSTSEKVRRLLSSWRVGAVDHDPEEQEYSRDPAEQRLKDKFGRNIIDMLPADDDIPILPGRRKRLVLDLSYVLDRLALTLTDRQAGVWLLSHNQRLGARPIDVLLTRGSSEVIQAVELLEQNAFG